MTIHCFHFCTSYEAFQINKLGDQEQKSLCRLMYKHFLFWETQSMLSISEGPHWPLNHSPTHMTDETVKPQRGRVTSPKTHSWLAAESGSERLQLPVRFLGRQKIDKWRNPSLAKRFCPLQGEGFCKWRGGWEKGLDWPWMPADRVKLYPLRHGPILVSGGPQERAWVITWTLLGLLIPLGQQSVRNWIASSPDSQVEVLSLQRLKSDLIWKEIIKLI